MNIEDTIVFDTPPISEEEAELVQVFHLDGTQVTE